MSYQNTPVKTFKGGAMKHERFRYLMYFKMKFNILLHIVILLLFI